MGGLEGKFDSKKPLHVQVTSSIPIVLFVFPFPVYFRWTDVTHFQCERPGMVPMMDNEALSTYGHYNTTGYYIPEEDDDALYNVSKEVLAFRALPRIPNYVCGMGDRSKRLAKSTNVKNKTKTTLKSIGIIDTPMQTMENITLQIAVELFLGLDEIMVDFPSVVVDVSWNNMDHINDAVLSVKTFPMVSIVLSPNTSYSKYI
jgi:hypothetical protein